jgi:hypothetical protein
MAAKQGQVMEMIPALGVIRTRTTTPVATATKMSTIATYTDRDSLETYLLSHGYTQTQLNIMNLNDLVYAAKRSQDPGAI